MKIYRKIGTCVHLVDEQNTDLKVSNLLGIAKDKCFMPSVANVIGTDLSKYSVIRKGRFACNLMHVNRDEVLPVALYMDDNPAIISPAYPMFEVNDPNELMPEYLNMYLMRKEFDREVVFYAMNGVRGGLEWEDFMDIEMPVPDIEEQRRIVSEYQTIEKRIENNNRLIRALEKTAQNIYHHMFVENIDPENLPEGWKKYVISDFLPVITGKKDANIATNDGEYMFFTCSQEVFRTNVFSFDNGAILLAGNGDFNVKFYKGKFEAYQRTYVLIPREQKLLGLLYNVVKYEIDKISRNAKGSVIEYLTKGMIENIEFYAPEKLLKYESIQKFNYICDSIMIAMEENEVLLNIKNLLLSKLS